MKNLSSPPAWHETPRTNAIVQELQSTPIPFDIAFWRLLELTRTLEVENRNLKKRKRPRVPHARQAKKKVVARKKRERPKAKVARKS